MQPHGWRLPCSNASVEFVAPAVPAPALEKPSAAPALPGDAAPQPCSKAPGKALAFDPLPARKRRPAAPAPAAAAGGSGEARAGVDAAFDPLRRGLGSEGRANLQRPYGCTCLTAKLARLLWSALCLSLCEAAVGPVAALACCAMVRARKGGRWLSEGLRLHLVNTLLSRLFRSAWHLSSCPLSAERCPPNPVADAG